MRRSRSCLQDTTLSHSAEQGTPVPATPSCSCPETPARPGLLRDLGTRRCPTHQLLIVQSAGSQRRGDARFSGLDQGLTTGKSPRKSWGAIDTHGVVTVGKVHSHGFRHRATDYSHSHQRETGHSRSRTSKELGGHRGSGLEGTLESEQPTPLTRPSLHPHHGSDAGAAFAHGHQPQHRTTSHTVNQGRVSCSFPTHEP